MGGCGSNNLYSDQEKDDPRFRRRETFVFQGKKTQINPQFRRFLKSSLLRNPSFHEVAVDVGKATDTDIDRMIDFMEEKTFPEGAYVCGAGNSEDDDYLGVITQGECRLYIDQNGIELLLKKGDLVGDILFLVPHEHKTPKLGMTKCSRPTTVMRIKRSNYDLVMSHSNPDVHEDLDWSEFLSAHLTSKQLKELEPKTTTVRFARGDVILKRGEESTDFYIVHRGIVKASIDLETMAAEADMEKRFSRRRLSLHDRIVDVTAHSRIVGEQGHFGEHSLISGKPQPYFIVAMVDVTLLKIPATVFNSEIFSKAKATLAKHVHAEHHLADTLHAKKKESQGRSASPAPAESQTIKRQPSNKKDKKIFLHMKEKEKEKEHEHDEHGRVGEGVANGNEDPGLLSNVVSIILLKGILY